MKKRGIYIFLLLSLISFVSAYSVNVSNLSYSNESYKQGDYFKATGFLNISQATTDSSFSSNLGEEMSAREFFIANDLPLSCEIDGCSGSYTSTSPQMSSKYYLLNDQEKTFGFLITGNIKSIKSVSLTLSSNFPDSTEIPLTISFPNNVSWFYNKYSEDYTREINYGCFDASASNKQDATLTSDEYCEKIELKKPSSKFRLGADISGSGSKTLIMSISNNGDLLGRCNFSASEKNYCDVSLQDFYQPGEFLVCIKSETAGSGSYSVSSENSGENCGRASQSSSFSRDYSIFVKLPKFKSAEPLTLSSTSNTPILDSYNYYLAYKGSDCTQGCYLPFFVKGVPQNLNLSSVRLEYSTEDITTATTNFYELESEIGKFNFANYVDFSLLNFKVGAPGNKTFQILFREGKIIEKKINVSLAPIISSLFPLVIPAGISMPFYINAAYAKNITSYTWDFGDGNSTTTTKSFIYHSLSNISFYNVSLIVLGSDGISSSRTFEINAISPKDYLNDTFLVKRTYLNNFSNMFNTYTGSWFAEILLSKINIDSYQSTIDSSEARRATSYSDEEFVPIAQEISSLNVPKSIYSSQKKTGILKLDYASFNPNIIKEYTQERINESLEEYKKVIAEWERINIGAGLQSEVPTIVFENGESQNLLIAYTLSLSSKSSEDSYLVIQDNSSFIFSNPAEVESVAGGKLIVIPAGGTKIVKFYSTVNYIEPVMYISPALSSLTLIKLEPCNSDGVCDAGESYGSCSNDCKPTSLIIWTFIITFILFITVYTFVQGWYIKNYETYLFKDRIFLFNLVSFIKNSQANGVPEKEIRNMLSSKSWSFEQISYALKKSAGKNTGMFEIIPLSKIMNYFRSNQTRQEQPVAPQNPLFNRGFPGITNYKKV